MLQLSAEEFSDLKSQIVTSSWGGRRTAPYAFTEQGVAMLSSVLRSPRAVQVNVEIMRTFVRLRRMLESHADLARELEALERKYDRQFKVVFDAIRKIMTPDPPPKRRFDAPEKVHSQPQALLFVPQVRVCYVGLGFRNKCQRRGHPDWSMSCLTCSHVRPESGFCR